MIKPMKVIAAALWMLAVIVACDTAKKPAQVDKDIAAAQSNAARNTEKAEEAADSKIAAARADVRSEETDAAHTSAIETQKVANTEAEGSRKVALAACESLAGAQQKSCRDQAQADYEAAKARAAQLRAVSDPKP
jgi:hypothetical protein